MVKVCVALMGVPKDAVRLAANVGGTKLISDVFSRFLTLRNTSCRRPPAATVGGYKPEKLTGFVVAFTSVIVATWNWDGSELDDATTNTVVGGEVPPAGTVAVGSAIGAV